MTIREFTASAAMTTDATSTFACLRFAASSDEAGPAGFAQLGFMRISELAQSLDFRKSPIDCLVLRIGGGRGVIVVSNGGGTFLDCPSLPQPFLASVEVSKDCVLVAHCEEELMAAWVAVEH